ncbi:MULTISPECIES: nuclear transport factor 2 family protein [Actinomadura]|uniref:Nuclear transport factor 2 family protein n=1 Tax=Actinomadura yumaensis TaxID=111807 RepID=A0ABW2CF16_9ACTN|nr:nuclear transport factor 2 family protein [Actinomadura sp. J1-007]MWK38235.1 hypothetical protein [Actinomadura sp. J1-007]
MSAPAGETGAKRAAPLPEAATLTNVGIVRRVYELFGGGDVTAIHELLSEDFHWDYFGPPELPWAGTYVGRQGVDRFFEIVGGLIEVEEFEALQYTAEGDRVVAFGTSSARVLASGARYTTHWVNIFTLAGGRITRLLDVYDTGTVLAALRAPSTGPGPR